ncbi:hypothetical protein ACG873_00560 (plasmid) [Mesorhizobium sp. AaZ16]|uniref:hypothetical protein n=1 Tax=Mesorhizobium sp. AaZ16 TaxID=3402289 RepID=UPI00374EEBC5
MIESKREQIRFDVLLVEVGRNAKAYSMDLRERAMASSSPKKIIEDRLFAARSPAQPLGLILQRSVDDRAGRVKLQMRFSPDGGVTIGVDDDRLANVFR